MRMQSRLTEKTPGETEVNMVSEVNVTGIMAQFGRGLIQDVSNQMLEKFTGAMRAELEKPDAAASSNDGAGASAHTNEGASPGAMTVGDVAPAAPPIEVISFGSRLLARAAGRTMRRPLFWVVAAAAAGCLYWLFR